MNKNQTSLPEKNMLNLQSAPIVVSIEGDGRKIHQQEKYERNHL